MNEVTSMRAPPDVDFSSLVQPYLWLAGAGASFSPAMMVAKRAAALEARRLAALPVPPGPVDWKGYFIDTDCDHETADASDIQDLLNLPDWCMEPIVDHFLDLAGIQGADEAVIASLEAFFRAPSEAVAKSHPILQRVPNPIEALAEIQNARKKELATWMGGETMAPVVLNAPVQTPPGLKTLLPGRLELWVSVKVDPNNIERSEPDIFDMEASLIHVREDGSGEPVGLMMGSLIPTSADGFEKDPESIFEFMDAHSNELNTVWRTVMGDFLPRAGFDDLETFMDSFDESDDDEGVSLCTPWILVDERFRGHEMSLLMMNELTAVCREALDFSFGHATLAEPSIPDGSDIAISCILEANPVRLFVVAVAGTPHREVRRVNPLKRTSVDKDCSVKVVDQQAERRRLALGRHFKRADSSGEHFRTHVYNPFDYTPT